MYDIYNSYLMAPCSIPMDKMLAIYRNMMDELDDKDEEAYVFYRDILQASLDYARLRSRWNLMGQKERLESDPERTRKHNRVILSINMLARYLVQRGKKAAWRQALGDENRVPPVRKATGDSACFLVFLQCRDAR